MLGGVCFLSSSAFLVCKAFDTDRFSLRTVSCQGKDCKQIRPEVSVQLPVVLLTGVLGFNKIGKFEYFRNVPEMLRGKGIDVFLPFTPPTGTIRERAMVVRKAVEIARQKTGKQKVHLVAHSMGGLDSRYYISKLGGGKTVATLVTIATPHRGAIFADWAYENIGDSNSNRIEQFLGRVGVKLKVFRQLTVKSLELFNQEVEDDPAVKYFSFGAEKASAKDVSLVFQLPYSITSKFDGPNDGVCSVSTARWGKYIRTLNASHLEQIGWDVGPFAPPFFWRDKHFDTQDFFTKDILPLLVRSEIDGKHASRTNGNKTLRKEAARGSITLVNPPPWTKN